jgi:secreted trypsin-like serine protease
LSEKKKSEFKKGVPMLKTWKHAVAHSVATTLMLGLVACGSPEDNEATSETKVTNGLQATANEYPSVVLLHFSTGGYNSSICTGTFVNDAQVVTAAHCVYDLLKAGRSASSMTFSKVSSTGTTRVAATKLQYHPGYTVVPGKLSNHDLAVVTFPRYSAPATTKFYPNTPYVGQKFTIVGFGVNDYKYDASGQQYGTGSGIKRKGQNEISRVSNGFIQFEGVHKASDPKVALGQDSASGSGDSGGPLLISGALAGVTSGGGLGQARDASGNLVTVKVSNYVDVNESSNQDFLESALMSRQVL